MKSKKGDFLYMCYQPAVIFELRRHQQYLLFPLLEKIFEDGIEQGYDENITQFIIKSVDYCFIRGVFDMALKIKREFGLEKAIEISGFSREELESEQLNIDFSPSLLSLGDD